MLSSNRSAFPSIKAVLSAAKHRPALPLFHPDLPLCAHSTFPTSPTPTCTYPFFDQYHLYNTVHYKEKKIICCHVQVPPGIHTRVRPLNSVVAHGSRRVWLSILRLVITIITFRPRAFSTPSQILHFVYILSFEYLVPVSRYCLSFLDRVEAEGRLQRWSCYSNIQICDLGERVPRMYLFQVSVEN